MQKTIEIDINIPEVRADRAWVVMTHSGETIIEGDGQQPKWWSDIDQSQIKRLNVMGINMPSADTYHISREAMASPGQQIANILSLTAKAMWKDGTTFVVVFNVVKPPPGN